MRDLIKLLATGEGERLLSTIRRLVESQGLPLEQVVRNSVDHMNRIEALAKRSGKSVQEVADEALALYERSL